MPRRRDFLTLAGPLAALSASAATRLPNLTMDPSQAKLTREPFGDLRIFFDGPTDQLRSMTAGSLELKPGTSPHPPHSHPDEEFLLVTAGTGEISVEGKITKVRPGSLMYCAANKVHGISAGKTPLLFYFFKWQK